MGVSKVLTKLKIMDIPRHTQGMGFNIWRKDFVSFEKSRIFALAFESESCKQEKHCNIVLTCKFAKF